ncbi:MAG: AmmeMemoRadiSam system protein A [Bacteroidota bacterium]
MLTESDQRLLLSLARQAIASAVNNQPKIDLHDFPAALQEQLGAFVTLYEDDDLRGCIGYLTAVLPLAETVSDAAVKAALCDPRFMPVNPSELGNLKIEISILSPLKTISNVEEIQVGRDGILIEAPGKKGVLLPKVAVEYGWDRDRFLRETSIKAGGPADLWKKPDSKIYTFTADVFCE